MPVAAGEPGWYRWDGGDLLLHLRVQPRASRDELGETVGDLIKARITAPPSEGKANRHLRRFLSRLFQVPPSAVELVSGERSRNKCVRIRAPRHLPEDLLSR
jgi:uncharacterized protein (TIGR00251 family)